EYNIICFLFFFFFQAEDGIRDFHVTGVQTCALPICCPLYHLLVGIYKNRYTNSAILEAFYHIFQIGSVLYGIPAVIGCYLIKRIWDQSYLCWLIRQYQVHKLRLLAISLYIEFRSNLGLEVINILIAYMPFIWAWMYSNPLCSKTLAGQCRGNYVGNISTSGIS